MEGGREGGKTEGKEDQKDEDVSLGRPGVGLSMLAHLSVVQTNSSEFSKIYPLSAIPDSFHPSPKLETKESIFFYFFPVPTSFISN